MQAKPNVFNLKNLTRAGFITENALRQVMISAFGMVTPFLVIRYCEKELWGAFVSLLLFSLLALQFINWGNKEYLLRQFSLQPKNINADYSRVFLTRLPLVFLLATVGFAFFPASFGFFILIWLLGRFLNHSVEALIIYEKKFSGSIAIEMSCFVVFCVLLFAFKKGLDLYLLLILYSVYQFAKGILYFLLFRNCFSFKKAVIDIGYFRLTFPFFLLSVLGFLSSKADVYIVERFCNRADTSDYQIINSLLVFVMSVSAFLYAPFTKNIYRTGNEIVAKTKHLLLLAGLVIVPLSLMVIYGLLEWYLFVRLPGIFYGIAFLYVFPCFVYGIEIVNLFRIKKERTVVTILCIVALTNAVISALLLNLGFGITGALAGSAIAQWMVLPLLKLNSNLEK